MAETVSTRIADLLASDIPFSKINDIYVFGTYPAGWEPPPQLFYGWNAKHKGVPFFLYYLGKAKIIVIL